MKRYQAVLFDLDGTLIDTNELIVSSFLHTLDQHTPRKYSREDVLAIMGKPLLEQMQIFDTKQAEEMVRTYQTYNVEKHDELVRDFPRVREVLHDLYQEGVILAVVSNKRRKVVEMGLKLYGLDQWMSSIVCAGEGIPAKPKPDMLQLALKELDIHASEALMVGDTKYDMIAGKLAGVDQVAVGWSLHPEELRKESPSYWIEDMLELRNVVLGEAGQ
ncbi:pyrophosphatase PpaX [Risungbinella massiliensis]|uniref:pyrophosphatase PpaX n=1 Tax=Risungbinella massiliensis TaxID=1329796 RepID=UPI0006997EBD|nr:pyrophosphatase PpaX [Risungbinella massiliensis]